MNCVKSCLCYIQIYVIENCEREALNLHVILGLQINIIPNSFAAKNVVKLQSLQD